MTPGRPNLRVRASCTQIPAPDRLGERGLHASPVQSGNHAGGELGPYRPVGRERAGVLQRLLYRIAAGPHPHGRTRPPGDLQDGGRKPQLRAAMIRCAAS